MSIGATLRDMARFGLLMLNNGVWSSIHYSMIKIIFSSRSPVLKALTPPTDIYGG